MKNKHLVLLFLFVVIIGVIFRWLPIQYRAFFDHQLIQLDENLIERLTAESAQHPKLTLVRLKDHWAVEQMGRTTPVSRNDAMKMVDALVNINEFETIDVTKADSLGFNSEQKITVSLIQQNERMERVEIGDQGYDGRQPVTFLRLANHEGLYQIAGHFRDLFARQLDDFRSKTVSDFEPDFIKTIGVQWPGSLPVYLYKSDSLGNWRFSDNQFAISSDSVLNWLRLFQRLNSGTFADFFDESREQEALHATIFLGNVSGKFLRYRFFYVKPPNVPDDLVRARSNGYKGIPLYVIHSSQNKPNYFTVPDSNLVIFICDGLLQQPQSDKTDHQLDKK